MKNILFFQLKKTLNSTFLSKIHLRIPNEPLRIKGIFDIRKFISESYLSLFRREIKNS